MELLKYTLIYIAVHVISFLWVRYWVLRHHYRVQHDKAFCNAHHPFMRTDLDKLHIIWSFPWYCTFWPRYVGSWTNMFVCTALMQVVMIGTEKDKISETRHFIMK